MDTKTRNEAATRILVVDDDPDVLNGTARVVEQAGYVVSRAGNGTEALRMVQEERPDLVLLDRNMPDMDGAEVCRLVKQDTALKDTFVILISGTAVSAAEQSAGLEGGADGYIVRPIGNRELSARIEAFVRILNLGRSLRKTLETQLVTNAELARANAQLDARATELEAANRSLLDSSMASINIIEDATIARQHAENAADSLRQSEVRFRLLIEKSNAGMYVLRDGKFVYANPRMEEILGVRQGELVGTAFDAGLLTDDLDIVSAAREKLAAGENAVGYTVRVRRADDAIVELGIHDVVAQFEGSPATIGMAQDIGERNRAQAQIKRYLEQLEHTTEGTLQAVSAMVEQRDPYTAGHERRVGELAAAIGGEMGMSEHTVRGLRLSGYVHDIGKVAVPAEILSKPGRLSAIEMELIKVHPQTGYEVLKNVEFPWPVAEVILQHHERMDGSGYPHGLKGGEILQEARVMAVADVVEAMSSHRPYRPGLGIPAALAEVEKNSGKHYDPGVVAACLRLFREKGYEIPN